MTMTIKKPQLAVSVHRNIVILLWRLADREFKTGRKAEKQQFSVRQPFNICNFIRQVTAKVIANN